MLPICLLVSGCIQQDVNWTPEEAAIKAKLEAIGGSLTWVQQEGYEICLDFDNENRTLDFSCLKSLKTLCFADISRKN